jgi:hypothetical protein
MRGHAIALLFAMALRPAAVDACACCDAKYRRTPIGWTEAGGALLIDAFDTDGCEHKARLEIWPVGAKEPSGCFDLFADPEKKIPCADLTNDRPGTKPKKSTQTKLFPKPVTQLESKKVRMTSRVVENTYYDERVEVDVESGATWRRVWSGVIHPVSRSPGEPSSTVAVSVWPNARGDRAVLLVSYKRTGTGNQAVDVHWIELR